MKLAAIIQAFLTVTMFSLVAQAAPEAAVFSHRLTITPEIKKAFQSTDTIEVYEVTGTTPNFQVGGTYRVVGTCRQQTLKHALLYIGNTTEAGTDPIVPVDGSSLYKTLPNGSTEFECTFTLLRPGILHATIYDSDNHNKHDNAHEGVYLGEVVFPQ